MVISFFDPNNPDVPATTNSISIRGDRFPFPGAAALMEAYDVYGNPLGSSLAADTAAGLTLAVNTPGIHKVRISQVAPGATGENGGIGLDNLNFNAVAARPCSGFTRALVSTSDSPPDGNGNFSDFYHVRLNDRGQAAFSAQLSGTAGNTDDDVGIYRADENFVVQIDRESLTGAAVRRDLGFAPGVALNNAGHVAYIVQLTNPLQGIFSREHFSRGDGGVPVTIAVDDQTAPDGNGKFLNFPDYLNFTLPSTRYLNDAGQVVFPATLYDTSAGNLDETGIYRGSGGPLTQVDREFTGAFSHYTPLPPAEINASGQVAYTATRSLSDNSLSYQVLRANGVTVTPLAQTGGTPPNGVGTFDEFAPIVEINDAGQVAFRATIDSGNLNDHGVFRANVAGTLTQIARRGQVYPDGVSRISSLDSIVINNSGQVAINSLWDDGSKGGILRGNGGVRTALVQTGQSPPDRIGTFTLGFQLIDMNDAGQVLFGAQLTGPGVTAQNDYGLFLTEGDNIIQIVREGTLWSSDYIADVIGSADLNENGQVAYSVARSSRFSFETDRIVALYTPPTLYGDFNEDGSVDGADLMLWQRNQGFAGSDFQGDHDNSGVVDAGDLGIWRSHFGQTAFNSAVAHGAVPEPGATGLLIFAAFAALCVGRRPRRPASGLPAVARHKAWQRMKASEL